MDRTIPQALYHQDYSPIFDDEGEQYHLVVLWDRHPCLVGNPLRVSGRSYIDLDTARANALTEWNLAWVACHPSLRHTAGA